MPQISIILPVYNGDRYLKESIESVLAQTFQDFELIIIDDCSTDNSEKIARDYVLKDNRVFYYGNDTNLKLPKSLNVGFSKARGQYWTWTSCDNVYLPDALEKLNKTLDAHDEVGLVYTSMGIIDECGKKKEIIHAGPADHLIFRNVVGACFLYRRSIAEKVGGYSHDLFLCEDYEYWLRIASHSKIHPIMKCLYEYRRHSQSLSHQNEREIIAKGIGIQKKYYNKFIRTRQQAALFYAYLRARDIYNPFRQLYLLAVLFYDPKQFFTEVCGLIKRRFS
jgi:glycosyltransferase involved in cell wall biosynthesis